MRSTAARREEHRVTWTRAADTLAWVRPDLAQRLLPFAAVVALVALVWRPSWLGVAGGDLRVQLTFGLLGFVVLFLSATLTQALLTRRRGAIRVPQDAADALLQGGYYILNGPLEEAFFRGLLQGGVGALLGAPAGFLVGTAAYVLYHRLGGWWWWDVAATALVGIPLGLAFWLLPGPHSLVGVSLAHIGATCGYIGPGPYLLRKLRLL
ncbi:MAG: CPBP family intramembrane metalloprotease [Chloroflexi bacterium]|nr:MAG: CPBP family intramembrane metalloprotease [Chloroflexota bacterium]